MIWVLVKPFTVQMTYPMSSLCESLMDAVLNRNNKFVNHSGLDNHMTRTGIVASACFKMMSPAQDTSPLKDYVFSD